MILSQPLFSAWTDSKSTIQNDTGAYFQDDFGCSKTGDCWIQYAGAEGPLSKEEREESERRLLEQRLWQFFFYFFLFVRLWRCQNRDRLPKDKCTKENLPNIPNVKKDIEVATKIREYYELVRRCLLIDDLRRRAVTPEMLYNLPGPEEL